PPSADSSHPDFAHATTKINGDLSWFDGRSVCKVARDHGSSPSRRTCAALSHAHEAGSVSRPATQSASLARSWASVGGRAGEPGGNCWLTVLIPSSMVYTAASSTPSSSHDPPG